MTPAWPMTSSIVKSSFLLPIEWGKRSGQDQGLENLLFCWNGGLLIVTARHGSAPLINHGELHPSLPSAEPHQQGSQQIRQMKQEFRVTKKRQGRKEGRRGQGAPQGVRDCAYHTTLCSTHKASAGSVYGYGKSLTKKHKKHFRKILSLIGKEASTRK